MPERLIRPEDWSAYDSREFADWCNQLEGLRSPVLVGTRSAAGVDNLAVFNSMTHIGARPPLLALVFRPLTVERHTYDNLRERGVYTVNHIDRSIFERAHATSAKLARGSSEFAHVGLTSLESAAGVPYVAESRVGMQLRFEEEHHVAANDTVIVIGRVEEFRLGAGSGFAACTELVEGERPIDWEAFEAVVVSGLYDYYGVAALRRMQYVEP